MPRTEAQKIALLQGFTAAEGQRYDQSAPEAQRARVGSVIASAAERALRAPCKVLVGIALDGDPESPEEGDAYLTGDGGSTLRYYEEGVWVDRPVVPGELFEYTDDSSPPVTTLILINALGLPVSTTMATLGS